MDPPWKSVMILTLIAFAASGLAVDAAIDDCVKGTDFSCLCEDQVVDCRSKNITGLPDDVTLMPEDSQTLDFSHNILTLISMDFSKFWNNASSNLRTISFNNNAIDQIEDCVFDGLFNLEALDLSNNNLTFIQSDGFRFLSGLQTLDLSRNHLTRIDSFWFVHIEHVTTLNLAYNPIGSKVLPNYANYFGSLRSLKHLDLSYCQLQTLPLDMFNNTVIEELRLSQNPLTMIPITPIYGIKSTLEMLDLNEICVDIIHNHAFHGLSNLERLFLNHLPFLTSIEALAFNDLRHMEVIEITGNKELSVIHPMAFYNTLEDTEPNLIPHVHLDNNNLSTISQGLLRWEESEMTSLGENPWHCDCEMAWLLDLKDSNTTNILFDDLMRCNSPDNLKDLPMNRLTRRYIGCTSALDSNHQSIAIGLGLLLAASMVAFTAFLVGTTKQCRSRPIPKPTLNDLVPSNNSDTVGYRRLRAALGRGRQGNRESTAELYGDFFEWEPPQDPKGERAKESSQPTKVT